MFKLNFEGNLHPPKKHKNVPVSAQWLPGQGEGTWFDITQPNLPKNNFRVRRISPEGNIDCDRIFTCNTKGLDITKKWQIKHVSHCAKVNVEQNNKLFELIFVKDYEG